MQGCERANEKEMRSLLRTSTQADGQSPTDHVGCVYLRADVLGLEPEFPDHEGQERKWRSGDDGVRKHHYEQRCDGLDGEARPWGAPFSIKDFGLCFVC